MASAIVNMFRQFGSVLGSSVLGTVLTSTFASQLHTRLDGAGIPADVSRQVVDAAANGTRGAEPPAALAGTIQVAISHAFTDATHAGFLVIGIVFLVVTVPAVLFVRHRPSSTARS
jgi:DHA2 family multidrug resistance protein-like MFS transporter